MSRRKRPCRRTDAEIEAALRKSGGNISHAVRLLGLTMNEYRHVRAVAVRLGFEIHTRGAPPPADPTPREQEALRLTAESGSQYRAAQLMGLSHQRVSQLVKRAKARIAAKGEQS